MFAGVHVDGRDAADWPLEEIGNARERIVGEQPLVDEMKITPVAGSAAGGPVMFAPPPPPGQMFAGPLPSLLPRCVGAAKSGASRLRSCARSSASFLISGVKSIRSS